MKLFKKKEKSKKPLSDKAKQERKDKTKRIIKRVLDILVYGFAIFMIFGLLLGSCNTKAKSGNAYYHSDNGYTSINSVVVNTDSTTTLRYYYDYNYKKTFPSFSTLYDVFSSLSVGSSQLVTLDEVYTIDNIEYTHLAIYRSDTLEYQYRITSRFSGDIITFVTLTQYDIVVNRSDILTGLFNGLRVVKPYGSNYNNWFRYLTYYFGELGYNRITYSMPINVSRLAYLFVNSDNTDNLIENGYFFKNDTFPSLEGSTGLTTYETLLSGSFRCNGVYYNSITFTFSSVYGSVQDSHGNYYPIWYSMPGSSSTILSSNEFYRGYWYIDSITFSGNGVNTLVWRAFTKDIYVSEAHWQYEYIDSWVGDTAFTSSPYRDLYIYYVESALTGVIAYPFNDSFPQLNGMSFADFINFIGEAYPSGNSGVPQDNTSPFVSVFEWLRIALSGAMPFFGYTLIPGITIGTLVMVPITMSIILFVVKLFKR